LIKLTHDEFFKENIENKNNAQKRWYKILKGYLAWLDTLFF